MGICISRRAMQATDESSSAPRESRGNDDTTNRGTEMLNPARLLLESPRISTDIGDMGMLGLLFHKRYCSKSVQNNKPVPVANGAYHKLPANGEIEESSDSHLCKDDVTMVIQQNALFEAEGEDGYPTFEPPSSAHTTSAVRSCPKPGASKGMWQSAGEEFYSDWEDPSAGTTDHPLQESVELGVFGAEDYFKEDVKRKEEAPVPSKTAKEVNDSVVFTKPELQASVHRTGSTRPCSSASSSSVCSSSGGGIRWASLCAGATSVEIDEQSRKSNLKSSVKPTPTTTTSTTTTTLTTTGAKPEILHISKMFKLLGSPSSPQPQQPKLNMSKSSGSRTKQKKPRVSDSQVKEWMDRARKSLDNEKMALARNAAPVNPSSSKLKDDPAKSAEAPVAPAVTTESQGNLSEQGFGSPFPSSPNSSARTKQAAQPPGAEPLTSVTGTSNDHEQHEQQQVDGEENEGNESDSSSDLFELDSVTTSLSSARSSLSRLSSARSSVRKSTVDEQDMIHFISDTSKPPPHKPLDASATVSSSKDEAPGVEIRTFATPGSASSSGANAAVLIMKNRRHGHSRVGCLEPGPLLSIVEESKPAGGRRRNNKGLGSSWNSNNVLAVQT